MGLAQLWKSYKKLFLAFMVVLVLDLTWNYEYSSLDPIIRHSSRPQLTSKSASLSSLKIIPLGDFSNASATRHPITVVTTLFRLKLGDERNHSIWIEAMLKNLDSPFVAFVDKPSARLFQKHFLAFLSANTTNRLRGVLLVAKSIWHVMDELDAIRNRTRSYLNEYRGDVDVELLLSTLKPHMASRVTHMNAFKSEFFMYVECDRSWLETSQRPQVHDWPNVEFTTQQVAKLLVDRVLFAQQVENDLSESTQAVFFAGSARAIERLDQAYYRLNVDFMFIDKKHRFGRKNLISHLLSGSLRHYALRLRAYDLNNCSSSMRVDDGSRFFFIFYYFASSDEYICGEPKLKFINS